MAFLNLGVVDLEPCPGEAYQEEVLFPYLVAVLWRMHEVAAGHP